LTAEVDEDTVQQRFGSMHVEISTGEMRAGRDGYSRDSANSESRGDRVPYVCALYKQWCTIYLRCIGVLVLALYNRTAMSPTYDALKLPEGIKTVLITGAGGERSTYLLQ
jgi:hypothetical protein